MSRILDFADGFESSSAPTVAAITTENVEIRTLTVGEAAAESLTLLATPLVAANVRVSVQGGPPQFYGDDYTVSGTTLSWSGLGLSGLLSSGDKLRIVYLS